MGHLNTGLPGNHAFLIAYIASSLVERTSRTWANFICHPTGSSTESTYIPERGHLIGILLWNTVDLSRMQKGWLGANHFTTLRQSSNVSCTLLAPTYVQHTVSWKNEYYHSSSLHFLPFPANKMCFNLIFLEHNSVLCIMVLAHNSIYWPKWRKKIQLKHIPN